MKKQFLLFALLFLLHILLFAQAPNQFKYQAVLRNADGTIIANAAKAVTVEILQGSPIGTVLFTENHSVTTTAQGIINLNIGSINTTGMASIDWSANTYFVKISVDGTEMGTSQLLSVPYALNAKNVENETDPVFGFSLANGITASDTSNWNNKLDSFTELDPSVPLGSVVGQLQYWNGTNWVILPAGQQGQVLGVNASNIPEWKNISIPELNPPFVEALSASNIESFSAQINANINAKGFSAAVVFEWGTDTSYGNIINAIPATVTGTSIKAVHAILTGLQSNTTYHCRIKASNAIDITYSADISFTTAMSAPQLNTAGISNVMALTASSGGNIIYDGGAPVTARGVCWSTTTGPTTDDSLTTDSSGTGAFTSLLTGLTPGTTYYVRAYATNAVGTTYGRKISFTTKSGEISLITATISSITGISAVSGGNVTSDGGSAVTTRGVCWSTTSGPTIADSLTSDGSGNGAFTSNLTELLLGTTYYVRAYATNSVSTYYGNELSFSTIALPTLTTDTFLGYKR